MSDTFRLSIDNLEKAVDDFGIEDILEMLSEICWLKEHDTPDTDVGEEWKRVGSLLNASH